MTKTELLSKLGETAWKDILVPIDGYRCRYVGASDLLFEQAIKEGAMRRKEMYLKDKTGRRWGAGYNSENAEDRESLLRLAITSLSIKYPSCIERVEKIEYPKSGE